MGVPIQTEEECSRKQGITTVNTNKHAIHTANSIKTNTKELLQATLSIKDKIQRSEGRKTILEGIVGFALGQDHQKRVNAAKHGEEAGILNVDEMEADVHEHGRVEHAEPSWLAWRRRAMESVCLFREKAMDSATQ